MKLVAVLVLCAACGETETATPGIPAQPAECGSGLGEIFGKATLDGETVEFGPITSASAFPPTFEMQALLELRASQLLRFYLGSTGYPPSGDRVTPASIPPHPLALPGRLIIDQWIDAPQCRAGRFTVTVGDDPAAFYGWFAFP